MNVKLLLRWFIPYILLLLISFGCDINEVRETYFPPLPTHTALPPTSTVVVTHQYDKIECIEDENTHYYEVSAYDHSTAKSYLNTYLYIHRGATVQISAGGIACLDPNPSFCYSPGGPDRSAKLVGKIGDGAMFPIGSEFEKTFNSESGLLYLAFSDSDYKNNSGFYEVCVTVY